MVELVSSWRRHRGHEHSNRDRNVSSKCVSRLVWARREEIHTIVSSVVGIHDWINVGANRAVGVHAGRDESFTCVECCVAHESTTRIGSVDQLSWLAELDHTFFQIVQWTYKEKEFKN